ncbi:RHS repeat-associated core domain-containing protein [Pseudomonas sp. CDFA 610]|uniref:RHS repeat-associated core domain-containing protein n=1 Tax=Pseudomonas sp. CDFA 610 TaxID=2829825 RepID=UPI001E446FA0|nr:RHS repeat-associated core domain-containing protein [Pseudomonas sp. CDFA 610]MCD5982497.1 RHS repeat-associated core domain-containing protein [Pseudomonas sp. CDFA 610]
MNDTSGARAVLRQYRYDALDRLAGVKNGAEHLASRFYQLNRLSVEVQGSRRRRVFQCEGQLLAEHDTEGSSARMDLLATDRQRSVLHSVGSQARQSPAYSPYGHRSQAVTFLGFNGEPPDAVTGHYLLGNGFRAFNPVLMRFNQPDNLSPFGRGGLNAYAYCLGDPVNRGDPSGHIPAAAGLSKLSPFELLPNEMMEKIVKRLSLKDSFKLSQTSHKMREKVSATVASPRIDIEHPEALLKIKSHLKGEAELSPAALKSDPFYRVQFEYAAKAGDERMVAQFNNVLEAQQALVDRVTDRRGASYFEFESQLARDRRVYADDPAALRSIDKALGDYRELDTRATTLIHQRADQGRLVDKIRRNLNA